jgi:hypothetical protein
MSPITTFLLSVGCVLGAVRELARYALRLRWALLLPKAMLAARLVAAESRLAAELNRSDGCPARKPYPGALSGFGVVGATAASLARLSASLRNPTRIMDNGGGLMQD